MRNSSLNEWRSAEDVTELKPYTEVEESRIYFWLVGECSILGEVESGDSMDDIEEKMLAWVTPLSEKLSRRKPKDSYATVIGVGLGGT